MTYKSDLIFATYAKMYLIYMHIEPMNACYRLICYIWIFICTGDIYKTDNKRCYIVWNWECALPVLGWVTWDHVGTGECKALEDNAMCSKESLICIFPVCYTCCLLRGMPGVRYPQKCSQKLHWCSWSQSSQLLAGELIIRLCRWW